MHDIKISAHKTGIQIRNMHIRPIHTCRNGTGVGRYWPKDVIPFPGFRCFSLWPVYRDPRCPCDAIQLLISVTNNPLFITVTGFTASFPIVFGSHGHNTVTTGLVVNELPCRWPLPRNGSPRELSVYGYWFDFDITKMAHQTDRLRWRHNGRDGVSIHLRLDFLLKRLFRRRSKKTSKPRATSLC